MRVLLVEDDIRLQKSIAAFLEMRGFEVRSESDGERAYDAIAAETFDLYLLDVNLPNISGLELIERVRSLFAEAPVVMITASMEIQTLTRAYENGCSEYIKKPFNLKELEIRIQRLLPQPEEERSVALDTRYVYNLARRELLCEGKAFMLRPKEERLLTLLVQNAGSVVSLESIETYVWEGELREQYPLRQLVSTLKERLESDLIHNVFRQGYKVERYGD